MSDLIAVRFLKDMAPYATNEIAGFTEDKVLEMEKKGVAERYDPNAVSETAEEGAGDEGSAAPSGEEEGGDTGRRGKRRGG